MKRERSHLWRADLFRALFPSKMFFSIGAIAFFYCVSSIQLGPFEDVCDMYSYVSTGSFSVLSYVFCAVPFATGFCEDMEHGYIKQILIRSRKWKYVLSKLAACFISAVVAFFGGNALYIFLGSLRYPFVDTSGNYYEDPLGGKEMVTLLHSGHYVAYLAICVFVSSLWAGVLAVAATCISLYLKNKMVVICMPMLIHYFGGNFVNTYLGMSHMCNPMYVFDIFCNIMKETRKSILYAAAYALILLIVLYGLCLQKIRRDYR